MRLTQLSNSMPMRQMSDTAIPSAPKPPASNHRPPTRRRVIAAVLAARVAGWRSHAVGNRPILWVLHLAYAWLPVALLLQALGALGLVMAGLATHAFTVGVLGVAIIAMSIRTALGHTGRMLVAGRAETVAYWLVAAAAVLRVFGPMAWPAGYLHWVWGAGACWVAGFGLYALTYAPRLAAPAGGRQAGLRRLHGPLRGRLAPPAPLARARAPASR